MLVERGFGSELEVLRIIPSCKNYREKTQVFSILKLVFRAGYRL